MAAALLGRVVPVVRENMERLYQFELDYRFDKWKGRTGIWAHAHELPRRHCRDVCGTEERRILQTRFEQSVNL